MYQVRIYIWQRNPSLPIGLTNLDHAVLSICRIASKQSTSIALDQKALFSRSVLQNPIPMPTLNPDQSVNLSGNVFPANLSQGMNYAQIVAILGAPNTNLRYNQCEPDAGTRILSAVNVSGRRNEMFDQFCQLYNHSIPCCFYLALVARGKNHTQAVTAVRKLRTINVDRVFTDQNGIQNRVTVDQKYSGIELINKLQQIGFN